MFLQCILIVRGYGRWDVNILDMRRLFDSSLDFDCLVGLAVCWQDGYLTFIVLNSDKRIPFLKLPNLSTTKLYAGSSRARRSLLQFKLELAKQLIGGFCGRKRYPGKKRKFASQDNAIAMHNLPGHQEVKFQGRKKSLCPLLKSWTKDPIQTYPWNYLRL